LPHGATLVATVVINHGELAGRIERARCWVVAGRTVADRHWTQRRARRQRTGQSCQREEWRGGRTRGGGSVPSGSGSIVAPIDPTQTWARRDGRGRICEHPLVTCAFGAGTRSATGRVGTRRYPIVQGGPRLRARSRSTPGGDRSQDKPVAAGASRGTACTELEGVPFADSCHLSLSEAPDFRLVNTDVGISAFSLPENVRLVPSDIFHLHRNANMSRPGVQDLLHPHPSLPASETVEQGDDTRHK